VKRSVQPVFWLLFGAGGMLSALIGMGLVFVTGLAAPLGLVPAEALGYDAAIAFARHWAGKAFLFAVIALFLWHGAHRIFHSLHDLGIRSKTGSAMACYGIALMGTIAAATTLLRIGSGSG
jgi:fumarate reductase subunit D